MRVDIKVDDYSLAGKGLWSATVTASYGSLTASCVDGWVDLPTAIHLATLGALAELAALRVAAAPVRATTEMVENALCVILAKHDPYGICAMGAPHDEYRQEAQAILKRSIMDGVAVHTAFGDTEGDRLAISVVNAIVSDLKAANLAAIYQGNRP